MCLTLVTYIDRVTDVIVASCCVDHQNPPFLLRAPVSGGSSTAVVRLRRRCSGSTARSSCSASAPRSACGRARHPRVPRVVLPESLISAPCGARRERRQRMRHRSGAGLWRVRVLRLPDSRPSGSLAGTLARLLFPRFEQTPRRIAVARMRVGGSRASGRSGAVAPIRGSARAPRCRSGRSERGPADCRRRRRAGGEGFASQSVTREPVRAWNGAKAGRETTRRCVRAGRGSVARRRAGDTHRSCGE
jgi:hypothetical protein